MELTAFQKILAELFIVIYMLSLAFATRKGELTGSFKKAKKLLLFALLTNFILFPAFGLLLLCFFELSRDMKIGLILLCISPGGMFTLNFVRVGRGNINLAVNLLLLLSLSAIVLTPFIAWLLNIEKVFSSILWLTLHLMVLIAVPLFIGRFFASRLKRAARNKAAAFLGNLSILLFISFNLLTAGIKSSALHSTGGNGLTIIVLLVLAGWLFGWLSGGKETENKKVLAISTSMRNVAFCYPFALRVFANTDVMVPIVAFSAVSIVMNMGFVLMVRILQARGCKA